MAKLPLAVAVTMPAVVLVAACDTPPVYPLTEDAGIHEDAGVSGSSGGGQAGQGAGGRGGEQGTAGTSGLANAGDPGVQDRAGRGG